MNGVLYNFINHKKINGTLFYCFEYYIFLKEKYDIKFFIFDINEDDLEFIKNVFLNKYNFNKDYLNDIVCINKFTDLYKLKLKNILIFDVRTFDKLNNFLQNTNKLVYSNEKPKTNNFKNTTFYGFYDYQLKDKITRLKFFKEIHKVFANKGDKIFISSVLEVSNEIVNDIIIKYNIKKENIFLKRNNKHFENLFEDIKEAIYVSTILDKNNRLIVECFIHNIPFIIYNLEYNDSIKERYNCIKNGNINEFLLDNSDIMITDFLKGIND